jgi:hypothetical protein
MAIQRAPRPQGNFYILDKSISEDRRLSWGARGLLVYLLGKPDHWQVSTAALIHETEDARVQSGRDSVRALLGELIDAGYVKRTPARAEGGKIAGYDYTVSEICTEPETDKPAPDKPGPAQPAPDQPATAQPAPANPRQVSTDSLVSIDKAASTDISGYSPEFDEAWAAYPDRPGKSKADAFKAWTARLKDKKAPATAEAMLAGVKRYAAYCAACKTEAQFIKQPATFFGPGRHFESDWTPPPRTPGNGRPSMNQIQVHPDDMDDGDLFDGKHTRKEKRQ